HGIRLPDDPRLRRLLLHGAPLLALAAAAHPLRRGPAALGADEGGRGGSTGGHAARLSMPTDTARIARHSRQNGPTQARYGVLCRPAIERIRQTYRRGHYSRPAAAGRRHARPIIESWPTAGSSTGRSPATP